MSHKHDENCNCKDNCCECEHKHGAEIEIGCCDGCSHEHSHDKEEKKNGYIEIISIVISVITLALGFMPFFSKNISFVFFLASALFSGYELVPSSLSSIKRLRMDENLLVLIAIVAAFAIGEGAEAAAVSLFFKIGESVEDYAVERSKKAIEKLYEITSNTATLIDSDGSTRVVDSEEIKVGDIILIAPFDKVAVDCVALDDGGTIDASAITGESIPIEITKGLNILSGSVNGSTVIKAKAVAEFKDSAASKIIETVENSQKSKGKTDKFITKFAEIYTPTVVCLAVVLAVVPSLIYGDWVSYIHRALVFLVASCPCALVLSVPLGFFAAIGAQSKRGIIVKGGKYIEKLAKIDTVLFDKTGTLTDDEFEINRIDTSGSFSEKDVLKFAAYAEKYSTHPLAAAVKKAFPEVDETKIENFSELSGNGTEITLNGERIICGSKKFMTANSIRFDGIDGAQIYVAVDGKPVGAITLSGKLRETSAKTVKGLYNNGIKRIVMLTGDNETAAALTAEKCGIKEFRAGLLPEQKTELMEEIKREGYSPAFVGDGINDTPTLVSADVGIAMGSGTAAAIEVGDVVLMNSNPENIVKSIKMARHGMVVIKENIWFAIAVKVAVLILGAFGMAPMWAAVFADVGVCIIAVLNAARLLIVKK